MINTNIIMSVVICHGYCLFDELLAGFWISYNGILHPSMPGRDRLSTKQRDGVYHLT